MAAAPALDLCVFCRRHPVDLRFAPFCSERCKMQDLAKWADGSYRVAGERVDEPAPDDTTDHHD